MKAFSNESVLAANINASHHFPIFSHYSLAIPYPVFIVLLIIYASVIFLAMFGSLLVILAFTRTGNLRTPSNSYLVNLAISDLLLVSLSCPITLAQLCTSHWPGPSITSLCRLAMFLPLLFSFTSTFSICLIAMDRHQLIVNTMPSCYRTVFSLACSFY